MSASFDLTTRYLGLELANPLVASASPLTGRVSDLLALEAAGVGAVVLPSLFEEQIESDAWYLDGLDGRAVDAEATAGYLPPIPHLTAGPGQYLQLVEEATEELDIPVIASLNGTSRGGWTRFAELVEEAGAAALELNIYRIASDAEVSGFDVENEYAELVASVRDIVDLPLAVKIGPQFSSIANMCRRLIDAGADGLVLFNRFYQPDIDLADLTVAPHLELSSSEELRFALRWVAMLRSQIPGSIATTTGVHSAEDVVKAVLAGSDVAMMTSALLKHGPTHVSAVLEGVVRWFTERDYTSVSQSRGSLSQGAIPNPEAFERANYAQTLASYPH